jgi:hypothetical protein
VPALALPDRPRPRHAAHLLAFVAGVAAALWRSDAALGPLVAASAVVQGLFAVVLVRVTAEGAWDYVAEYRRAGGRVTDAPVAGPVAVGLGAGVGVGAAGVGVGAAAWAAVLAFGVAVVVTALVAQVARG